ncbi:19738_t:CDS:2, partial [Funneliformis geosporum]
TPDPEYNVKIKIMIDFIFARLDTLDRAFSLSEVAQTQKKAMRIIIVNTPTSVAKKPVAKKPSSTVTSSKSKIRSGYLYFQQIIGDQMKIPFTELWLENFEDIRLKESIEKTVDDGYFSGDDIDLATYEQKTVTLSVMKSPSSIRSPITHQGSNAVNKGKSIAINSIPPAKEIEKEYLEELLFEDDIYFN